jgi:hypothetical protein
MCVVGHNYEVGEEKKKTKGSDSIYAMLWGRSCIISIVRGRNSKNKITFTNIESWLPINLPQY